MIDLSEIVCALIVILFLAVLAGIVEYTIRKK